MATPEHCIGCAKDISKSSRSLGPIPLATPVARKQALSGRKFLFRKQQQQSPCNRYRDQKGAGEENSKGSFHTPLEGWQKHISQQGRHDNFQLQIFSVSYSSCLAANKADVSPQTYGGGIPWLQISLVGVAMPDYSRRWEFVGNCYT